MNPYQNILLFFLPSTAARRDRRRRPETLRGAASIRPRVEESPPRVPGHAGSTVEHGAGHQQHLRLPQYRSRHHRTRTGGSQHAVLGTGQQTVMGTGQQALNRAETRVTTDGKICKVAVYITAEGHPMRGLLRPFGSDAVNCHVMQYTIAFSRGNNIVLVSSHLYIIIKERGRYTGMYA